MLHNELMPILHRVVERAGNLAYPLTDAGADTVAAHLGAPGELTLAYALPRLLSLFDQCFARIIEIVMAVESVGSATRSGSSCLESSSANSKLTRTASVDE